MNDETSGDSASRSAAQLPGPPEAQSKVRRRLIKIAVAAGISAPLVEQSFAAKTPDKMRPQPGDLLVHRFGDRKGQAVKPEDVPTGAEMLQVSAMDTSTDTMRDGSRLNGINLVRVTPDLFDDDTRPFAVGEIIAYSSVCTHQGCDLTQWLPESQTFKCYCHYSEFNAAKFGSPMHGPARRRLAVLPIELSADQTLLVTDEFQGKVGFKKK